MTFETFPMLEKGSLLVASPDIETGLFFRSVILLCEHHPDGGSFGLILNKPVSPRIPEDIFDGKSIVNPGVAVRAGGPCHPDQMMLLHANAQVQTPCLSVCENVFLGGDLEFLRNTIQDPEGSPVRLCFGYCAWNPGEPEKQIAEGQWFVTKGSFETVFTTTPEILWQSVLRQMGGKYVALSLIPEDIHLN